MKEEQMLAALQALPDGDLMTETKIDDPLGAGIYYRADTVVRLLAAERNRLAAAVAAVVHDFKASGDTELDELVRQAMRDLCTRMGVEFKA